MISCVIINDRLLLDTECQEACIHGIKLRRRCDDCVEWLENSVVKSLPMQYLPNCTRVEVIDQKGRSYVNWKPTNKVRLNMQDDGRTVKIFID